MRLWSIHPRYLDPKGLVALWREALLAQAVLAGRTRGYRNHPQLSRFRACAEPQAAIASYLAAVAAEAARRGYRFDESRIGAARCEERLPVPAGQVRFEWEHLMAKLRERAPDVAALYASVAMPDLHPLFWLEAGPVATWERAAFRK